MYNQSHGATELRGAADAIAEEDEGGAGFARESREANGGGLGEHRRAIEHHEREGAAAEQDVGGPGGAHGIVGADDDHPVLVAEVDPVACVEGTLGVDVGHPAMRCEGGFDDDPCECRLAAARAAHEFREPAAGQSSAQQRIVE